MKNNYILLLVIILPLFNFSQGKSFWTKTESSRFSQNQLVERSSTPAKYAVYNLNIEALKNTLNSAVNRSSNVTSNVYVKFPNADGEMERYQIYNASNMEPEFASRHPEIQAYIGINRDDPGTTIRFSTTIFGFHAIIHSIGTTYYIDPFSKDLSSYVFYAKGNLYSDVDRLGCQITEELESNGIYQRDTN